MQKLSKFNLLILDDFGVTPLKADELNDLFEVIEERTLGGSTIVTAQLPIKEWHSYLGNETIADAMMDRLIYSAHRIEMKGESMRKIMAQKEENQRRITLLSVHLCYNVLRVPVTFTAERMLADGSERIVRRGHSNGIGMQIVTATKDGRTYWDSHGIQHGSLNSAIEATCKR